MTIDARSAIATYRASHERLAGIIEALSGEGLRQMSFDTEWTIAQVVSHLGSQTEIMDATFVAIRDGDEAPGRDAMPAVWDRWNAMSPEEQRAGYLDATAVALEHLEALTDDQVDTLHLSLFDGLLELDVAGFARMRISEHAMHTWDVAVALDPSATLSPSATEVLLDLDALGPLVARAAKPQGTPIRLRVEATDPSRHLALLVDDGAVLEPWADQDVAGSLRLPAEAFLRLVYGRLRDADDVQLDADGIELTDLRAVFPGF